MAMERAQRIIDLGVAAVIGSVSVMAVARATAAWELRDEVVALALTAYVHGIDDEIAQTAIGPEGLPVLHQLLGDPTFPRRDNVVAFLTYLGDNSSAGVLSDFLRNPPASPERAEEDRALLLAPHALGEISARGNSLALRVLLGATRNGSEGGILAAAAAGARSPESMRDDLLEMAVRGLGRSGRGAAEGRLREIAQGRVVPAPGGRHLRSVASASLRQAFERPHRRPSRPEVFDSGRTTGGAPLSVGARQTESSAYAEASAYAAAESVDDVMLHDSALDYFNHVDHPSPMTDSRLDAILASVTMRAGREDFVGDDPCCVLIRRQGTAQTFGTPGDGLDIIDNESDMYGVLGYQAARVKVVRLINWCGTPAMNFIGCGYVGGYGVSVVRYSDLESEGSLWLHEYGHNVGLTHNTSNQQLFMYPSISRNSGLTVPECAQLRSPSAGALAEITSLGRCVHENLEEFCGNGVCEVDESPCTCVLDCGEPAAEVCNDGIDNDCDGAIDCNDDRCAEAMLCLCAPVSAACQTHSDCCSYECMGSPRRKTCRNA